MANKKPTGLKKLAIQISKREGGKVNLTIAQIDEVLKCLREIIQEELEESGYKSSSVISLAGKEEKN